MAKIIFISGGCRSGKSAYAQIIAEKLSDSRLYLATCPRGLDEEMEARIDRHIMERGKDWHTMEEPFDLCGAIRCSKGAGVILVDCLTLWVSNLMQRAHEEKNEISEDVVSELCLDIFSECKTSGKSVIFVTNETGLGIVPDNDVARSFRDLLGRCNQVMASCSDEAYFMVSGLPLRLK